MVPCACHPMCVSTAKGTVCPRFEHEFAAELIDLAAVGQSRLATEHAHDQTYKAVLLSRRGTHTSLRCLLHAERAVQGSSLVCIHAHAHTTLPAYVPVLEPKHAHVLRDKRVCACAHEDEVAILLRIVETQERRANGGHVRLVVRAPEVAEEDDNGGVGAVR